MTRLVFKHHVYEFGGQAYKQARGGTIGLRFTSVIARIVMDYWLGLFLTALLTAGLTLLGIMKYVDDVNVVCLMVALGTRWTNGTLTHNPDWELEDAREGLTREQVTMTALRTAADEILPWLTFTSDLPCQHGSLMVPMLDLQVWVRPANPEDPEDHDLLGWTFFSKPTASDKVLRASSAYNWRSKLVTLNMEVFRRMRNVTRQVTTKTRVDILEKFVAMMRDSGYVEKTVEGVVRSGLQFYSRKIRIELEGGPLLNQRSESQTIQRRRQKLGATESWFTRRRGGASERGAKDNGWRDPQSGTLGWDPGRGRKTLKYSRRNHGPRSVQPQRPEETGAEELQHQRVLSTLLVPFTIGSKLKNRIQEAEDEFAKLVGGGKVRVVERGGDLLSHLLGPGQKIIISKSIYSCDSFYDILNLDPPMNYQI